MYRLIGAFCLPFAWLSSIILFRIMPREGFFVSNINYQNQSNSQDSVQIKKQQNLMTDNGSLFDWLSSLGVTKELNNVDILSGMTVNATLSKIVPNYTVRLPASNTASTRINNWNTVINELEKVGIKVVQQDKSKILNGDDKVVYGILYELKSMQQKSREEVEVDINKIDSRGDPLTSKSLLELFILVIIKHFGFSIKEAVALLSNDSKYLAHILAKGFKDNPQPVQNLLHDLMKLIPQINTFCKNKQNETFFLKSIKPALISKYLSIMQISLQLLTEFVKDLPEKLDIVKNQLMPTFVLSQRRHTCQIRSIIDSLLQILGVNVNLVSFILAHSQTNEASLLLLQLLNAGQEAKQLHEVFTMFKFSEFVEKSVDHLKSSEFFANSGTFLLKVIECNYPQLLQNNELLSKLVQNLSLLTLSKRSDVMIFTNLIFGLLHVFGSKKNQIAPQLFKLAVDKYRNNLNEDESQNFLINFINIMEIFPSIPAVSITEAVLFRYQTSTSSIGELQLQIIENSIQAMEQKGALRVYNIITKIFVEEVGRIEPIINILESIIKKYDSKLIFDLNVKFVKICLAIYYANIRKLNYNKSLVEGVVKLDATNAFHKAKNNQIEQLLTNIVSIRDTPLNQAIQPLICYTFFQAEMKNREEAQGIKTVMLLLGNEEDLRKLYEADARLLLDQSRNEGKKKESKTKEEGKVRVSSDASLLNKKKDYLLNHPPKVSLDAQKGLQKYTKVFKQKMVKLFIEEEKKAQEEERLEELRKKFTLKILEKGIKIAKDVEVNCIYDYGTKQKELEKDLANDFAYLPFYDPEREEDRDVKAVQYFTKKYNKLFKVYYNNYGGKLRPNTIKLFDDISHTSNLMQSANVWKLLRDNDLDLFITVKEVQHTVQKINANLKKEYKDSSLLDFEVFENFLIQAALIMFSRAPKDMRTHPLSDMLQEIVTKLRQHAHDNKIDERLFDEMDNYQSTKNQQIRDLNEKLVENPDYILPEGYKKITVKRLVFNYEFHLDQSSNIGETSREVYEILDEILFDKFGFHLLEPSSSTSTQATARPLLYQTSYMESMKERSLSSALPKASRMRETTVKEGEGEEEPPQESEERGEVKDIKSPSYLQKIQNKFLKQKKIRQEQKQKRVQEEEKKREQRDRELKILLEKHRQKQQEMQKEKEQKKKEEVLRQEEQKKKKQKYEQDLKKRVEEYMRKKEADKTKEEEERKRKRDEENKNFEKMKQDIERKKKMVEETKNKKKQEQQQRLQREKEEKKKAEEESRAKQEEKKEKTRQMIEQYRERKQREQEEKQKQKETEPEPEIKSKLKIKNSIIRKSKNSPPKSKQEKDTKEVPNTELKVEELDNN